MNIDDFLTNRKNNIKSENDELFTMPNKDKKDDMPHIKKNIFKENILHQCDILFLPTSEFGFKYCLLICDVYNNKIDGVALKNKSSIDVVRGLTKIYNNDILEHPFIIQFDSGSEFKNKDVKEYCKENKLVCKYILVNRHRQNSNIENANFRLGKLIMEYQSLKELKTKKIVKSWHKDLAKYIKYLNDKSENLKKETFNIYEDIAGNEKMIELLEINDKVKVQLDYPISSANDKKLIGKFRAGDIRYSKENFKIMHIILNPGMPPMYMVNDKNDDDKMNTRVAYTRNQLLLVE